jgi:hypothetical protein
MEQTRILWRLLFENIDATFADPAPDLASEKKDKDGKHPASDLIPQRGHGQEGVEDSIPGLFREVFDFDGAKGAIEETLESIDEATGSDESEVCENLGGDGVSGV